MLKFRGSSFLIWGLIGNNIKLLKIYYQLFKRHFENFYPKMKINNWKILFNQSLWSTYFHTFIRDQKTIKLTYEVQWDGRTDTQTAILLQKVKKCNVRSKIWWFTDSAIRITYRISLRSSSLREPRHPSLKVIFIFFVHKNFCMKIKKYVKTKKRSSEKIFWKTITKRVSLDNKNKNGYLW